MVASAKGGVREQVRDSGQLPWALVGRWRPRIASRHRVVGLSALVSVFAALMYWIVLPPPYFADAYNYFTAARR